jgi:hypothetical protein
MRQIASMNSVRPNAANIATVRTQFGSPSPRAAAGHGDAAVENVGYELCFST